MKVLRINPPPVPVEVTYQVTCGCGADLEFTSRDIVRTRSPHWLPDEPPPPDYVVCPNCRRHIVVALAKTVQR